MLLTPEIPQWRQFRGRLAPSHRETWKVVRHQMPSFWGPERLSDFLNLWILKYNKQTIKPIYWKVNTEALTKGLLLDLKIRCYSQSWQGNTTEFKRQLFLVTFPSNCLFFFFLLFLCINHIWIFPSNIVTIKKNILINCLLISHILEVPPHIYLKQSTFSGLVLHSHQPPKQCIDKKSLSVTEVHMCKYYM